MSIDRFLGRKYNKQAYNCAHLVAEVWQAETGIDIAHKLAGFLRPPRERSVAFELRRAFRRLEAPQSPCIVLMTRPHSVPHVGIYLRGKVLHIHEVGVEYQPIDVATRGFNTVRFYTC